MTEHDLVAALEMVTEGPAVRPPDTSRRRAFAPERFRAEAEGVRLDAVQQRARRPGGTTSPGGFRIESVGGGPQRLVREASRGFLDATGAVG